MSTLESPFDFPENRDLMNLIYHHSPYSKKIILDYYDSRFWIVDSLSVELGRPDSRAQDSKFYKQKFPVIRIFLHWRTICKDLSWMGTGLKRVRQPRDTCRKSRNKQFSQSLTKKLWLGKF